MTARTVERATAAIAVAAVAVLLLGACDPVAWMRKSPQERSTSSVLPTAAPTEIPTACTDDDGSTAAAASELQTVPYRALSNRALFTSALETARGRIVTLPAGTTRFTDFRITDGKLEGGLVGPAASGLIGAGIDKTTLELAPHSSTEAAAVPLTFPETNPLYVLRVAGDGAVLKDFTIRATDQGHLYNGLRIDRVAGLRASDIRVVGIPGNSASPPGETFAINDFKTIGSVWSNVRVDGAGVGASGFGVNSSTDTTVCNTESSGSRYAMGFAFWQSSGLRLIDCTALDNGYSGFNFERMTGSNVLIRPVAHGNRYDMRIASDQESAKFTIIDPQLVDGHWTITLPKTFYGRPNQQQRSDITLIVNGQERPDLLRFQTP